MDLVWFALSIISIPYQLAENFVFTTLNFLTFDVLRLGPHLPIQL